MEKFIEIYDNFLPKGIEDRLEYNILNTTEYLYLYNLVNNQKQEEYIPGFSCCILDMENNKFSPQYSFQYGVLYYFLQTQNIIPFQILNARIFLQVPSLTSKIHTPHTDLNTPHWVVLYYVNDTDGDTIFYNDNKEEIKRVSPKKGRVVFFDGSIMHSASTPTQTHRAIINFSFTGEKL